MPIERIKNLTNPGAEPQDGDRIQEFYTSGAIVTKTFSAPEPRTPSPTAIGLLDFTNLLRDAAGLTKADVLAIRQSTNTDIAYISSALSSGITFTPTMQDMVEALDALETDGHLTSTQRQAVVDNWPTR
jgi:hypothetical protein